MDHISCFCKAFSLTINLDKIAVMFQTVLGSPYNVPSICVGGYKLKVVDKFTHLEGNLDDEITAHLKKSTDFFEALKDQVWSKRKLKCTKMAGC